LKEQAGPVEGGTAMKAALLLTGGGSLVILTSHGSLTSPGLLEKLAVKGIDKFIAYEIPTELARERYGGHFDVVIRDLHESDDLRVLDYNGQRAFRLFRFDELPPPIVHDAVRIAAPAPSFDDVF
jgi:hypothetical protein